MSKASDKFIALARERFKQAQEAEDKQRKREIEDLRFYAGEQWDSDILKSRQGQTIGSGTSSQVVPARPSLTINKTREPVRQVLNQERNADLGITVIPADDFGEMSGPVDHTEIKLREGLVRRIQRDSEAADARTWAFSRSAIAGRGYWGVMTRYVPKRSDQEIYVHRFYNQSSVLLDPAHEQPDGSDADWAFVGVDMSWDRYKAEYPSSARKQNRVTNASDEEWKTFPDEAPGWFTSEGETRIVRVCEYWYTERESVELFHLSDGRAVPQDALEAEIAKGLTQELDDDQKPVSHTDVQKQIKWCKLDGLQVIDETDWPGHYIPIIKVLGEELQPYDNERRCEGIVRPMIDPCRGNNYVASKFVERVGLAPMSPWMMAAGQDEGYEDEYNASSTRALSRLHYNQKDVNQAMAPPPFRTDVRSEIQDLAFGVQMFSQFITSTSVVPETALGNTQPGVKSGRMARLLIDQATQGTSNFLDNLVRSMRHEARIINDLLYPIYGRPGRLARMMNPQGEMSAVIVGQPFTLQGEGPQARPIPVPPGQDAPDAQIYKLTPDAEFNVAVKVSKNFNTRREEEAAQLGEIIAADPQQMQVIGDLFFKYQDGPGHEEMSERYKAVLLPQVQATLGTKGQSPAELQQQLTQAMQAIQALTQQVEQQNDIIKTDAVKTNGQLQQKHIQEQAENERTSAELAMKERLEMEKLALERQKLDTQAALEARKLEVQLEIEMAKLGQAAAVARAEVEMDALHLHSDEQQAEADRNEASAQADLDRKAAADAQEREAAMASQGAEA